MTPASQSQTTSLLRYLLGICLFFLLPLAACTNTEPVAGDPNDVEPTAPSQAQYLGLQQHSVAILVAADENMLYAAPDAPRSIAQILAARLTTKIPGIRLLDPAQLAQFQRKNPYWETLPPADLLHRLGVERLIWIDLAHLSLHEPGNAHVWQGTIVADVAVAEADSLHPNQFAYRTTISARYPEQSTIGLLDSHDATVQLGLIKTFARNVSLLFYNIEKSQ